MATAAPPPGARRFYTTAQVARDPAGGAATLRLDARALKTPSGRAFAGPEPVMAAAAAEWEAQGERIDPLSMPVTRAVNTAIERVAPQRDAVIDDIAGYAASDLLCHRADRPAGLAAAQAAAWDPPLVWLAEAVGARLAVTAGVMPSAQSPKALEAVRAAVARRSDLELTALHELTTLSGSVALALMVAEAAIPAAQAWRASRVDEEWQIAEWGRDEEAEAAAARRARAFLEADALLRLLG